MSLDWMIEIFLTNTWTISYQNILCRLALGEAFTNVASPSAKRLAVYHCSPRQLFSNLNEDKQLAGRFAQVARPKQEVLDLPTRLCIEYFKDRWVLGRLIKWARCSIKAINMFLIPMCLKHDLGHLCDSSVWESSFSVLQVNHAHQVFVLSFWYFNALMRCYVLTWRVF